MGTDMQPPSEILALRRKLGQQVGSGHSEEASETLINLVFREDDRQWLEDRCLELLQLVEGHRSGPLRPPSFGDRWSPRCHL